MTKTWCVGGKHYFNTNNITQYEKVNRKIKKLVKIIKGSCSICGRINRKFLPSKLLKEQILFKEENLKIITVHLCQILHGLI